MNLSNALARGTGKTRRVLANNFARRMAPIETSAPIVSFSFDDAPKTAFGVGREILKGFGARPTYYVSLGLLDSETEVGLIGSRNDLAVAISEGCELGCHTYDHLDAWHSSPGEYMASVGRNRQALEEIMPGARFESFAYPKSGPTLAVKSALAEHFSCCRAGGQAANEGEMDLGLLKAVFLDRRTGLDAETIRELTAHNAEKRGWLIFATHDITAEPSPFGCTPEFLEMVASAASQSGAIFLPVSEACARLTTKG